MRKLSLLDLAFFIAESEESPKHVATLMRCKKPPRSAPDYAEKLIQQMKAHQAVSEPFNLVINFLRLGGPQWEYAQGFSIDNHVFYHHPGKPISWEEAKEMAALLHEPMLDRSRPMWEFHLIDGIRGGKFALYLKLHHAYADGVTMTRWMDGGLSESDHDPDYLPPWSLSPPRPKRKKSQKPALPRPGKALCGLAELAKKQVRSTGGLVKLAAQQCIERAGLTQDAVALLFNTPADTPLTGSATAGRSVATSSVPMKRVRALCDATCSTLNHVALCCIDGAVHAYLARQDIYIDHPISIQMPVNLRDSNSGDSGNKLGITLVDLARPTNNPYRRLREISFKLHNVKYQVAGIPAVSFEQFTMLAGTASEMINKLQLTDALPANGHAVVSNLQGPDTSRYLMGSRVERIYPISTLSPGLRLNVTIFSYDGVLHFGLVSTRDLEDLQSLADLIAEEFSKLEDAVKNPKK